MSGESLARRLLRVDAAYCAGAGLIAVGAFAPLARLLHAPPALLLATGVATVAWALALLRIARRAQWRLPVAAVASANTLAAAAIAALAAVAPGTAARLLLAAVAVEVGVLAAGQAYALRR